MKNIYITLLPVLILFTACDASNQGTEHTAIQSENTTQSTSTPKPLSNKEKQFVELKKNFLIIILTWMSRYERELKTAR